MLSLLPPSAACASKWSIHLGRACCRDQKSVQRNHWGLCSAQTYKLHRIHPSIFERCFQNSRLARIKKKVCLQEITDTFKADFSALTLLFALFRISGIHWFSLLSHLQKKCDIQWWNKSSWNCGMQAWCCKWELRRHNWSTWYVILENFIYYSMLTLDWLKCSLLCCLWQVLSSRSWKTPWNYLTMKIGESNHLEQPGKEPEPWVK